VYWDTPYDERDDAEEPFPACSSMDAVQGYGEKWSERQCEDCEFSEWGTARGGESRGQACQERMRIYLLPEDVMIPHLLEVPATSIKIPRKYVVGLAGKGLPYWGVVTHFGAQEATNRSSIKYSLLSASLVGQLRPEDRESLIPMRITCQKMAVRVPLTERVSDTSADEKDFADGGDEEVFKE